MRFLTKLMTMLVVGLLVSCGNKSSDTPGEPLGSGTQGATQSSDPVLFYNIAWMFSDYNFYKFDGSVAENTSQLSKELAEVMDKLQLVFILTKSQFTIKMTVPYKGEDLRCVGTVDADVKEDGIKVTYSFSKGAKAVWVCPGVESQEGNFDKAGTKITFEVIGSNEVHVFGYSALDQAQGYNVLVPAPAHLAKASRIKHVQPRALATEEKGTSTLESVLTSIIKQLPKPTAAK